MKMSCIGTSAADSRVAVEFALKHEGIFASVGVHPHESKDGLDDLAEIIETNKSLIVAIGEIGLDYHYDHSPRDVQIQTLKAQIDLALKYNLPIIFHVREGYDDFWPIFDEYISKGQKIRGVLHSFTDTMENAQEGLKRGLYIGVNGYSTFVKDESQKAMFAALPLDKILLETDAPYLTPTPFRGKVNEPAFVSEIAEHQAAIRQISFDEVAAATTANACALFNL
jgi:TatD DNase family protein